MQYETAVEEEAYESRTAISKAIDILEDALKYDDESDVPKRTVRRALVLLYRLPKLTKSEIEAIRIIHVAWLRAPRDDSFVSIPKSIRASTVSKLQKLGLVDINRSGVRLSLQGRNVLSA